MCGICGLLAPSGAPDPALVERMNAALVHRGPDEGSVDAFGRCVIGNRRLQVIDLVGKKPLLWARLPDGTLAFASELKALLRLPGLSREPDPAMLDAFLALQYVPAPRTALRSVEKLRPGHVLVAENGSVRIEPYWRLQPRSETPSIADVREAVTAAVRRRLIADVPLGALLSGGIDSSIVVACMAQAQ